MDKKLVSTNQSAKVALTKSKKLLIITSGILANKDDKWLDFLLDWADKNIIQEKTDFPKNKDELSKAKHISLRWNRLKSLPKELFNLVQLETMELNNNALEVLPKEIGNLKKLKQLNLNINSLKTLDLSGNKIKNIPDSIGNLNNLTDLNLGDAGSNGNYFKNLPLSIINLKKLTRIMLWSEFPLSLTNEQKKWLRELKSNNCTIGGSGEVMDVYFEK